MRLLVATTVLLALAIPTLALAQAGHQTSSGGSSHDGSHSSAPPGHANPHHATPARLAIVRGGTAYVAHNYDAAMSAFREVPSSEPEYGEAILDVGYTLNARNDHDGALAAFREALQRSVTANDDWNRARALQAIANTYEVTHAWNDALTAWQEFVSFAESHSNVATAAIGRQRIDAIHTDQQLVERYAPVRQRIEERRRHNASAAPAQ
jgi:tetratricopeptide (TPR) repeat protein